MSQIDRQTDRWTCHGNTALCVASCKKNHIIKSYGIIISQNDWRSLPAGAHHKYTTIHQLASQAGRWHADLWQTGHWHTELLPLIRSVNCDIFSLNTALHLEDLNTARACPLAQRISSSRKMCNLDRWKMLSTRQNSATRQRPGVAV